MGMRGGYRPRPEPLKVSSRVAKAARRLRSRTPARLYVYETLIERPARNLQDVAAPLGPFIQEEPAVVGQRHLARQRHVASADQPHLGDGVMGARHGRVVTKAVRSPVRPATLWMRVVSRASTRVMAGRRVVSRCASIDVPVPRGAPQSLVRDRLPGGYWPRSVP
jgi:hypothetical protein